MPLSDQQVSTLLKKVASTKEDSLDCDSCFVHLAEFAEIELAGREVPEALKAVERHIQECGCCDDEYTLLLKGLKSIET